MSIEKHKFPKPPKKRRGSLLWWFRQKCRFWQPIATAIAAIFSLLLTLLKLWQYFHP
ncbi:hypothetical protein [Calothrix sp. NIES-2098]|uniref:hypothetical protein n=1 Tax=Calothrix sp. NIES-2098 TaxID=1954171 RepID=UPI0030D91E57